MLVGIDEVGRGCLAGPVCVAAVALDDGLVDAMDSKKLDAVKRTVLNASIKRQARLIGIGWSSHTYIDSHGMTAALKRAAQLALQPFGNLPELILLDGNTNYIDDPRVATFVDGDEHIPLISAASIVAKVARDSYMRVMDKRFPVYGFDRHVGYGTVVHRAAIAQFGPCAIHRLSFAPLKDLARVN